MKKLVWQKIKICNCLVSNTEMIEKCMHGLLTIATPWRGCCMSRLMQLSQATLHCCSSWCRRSEQSAWKMVLPCRSDGYKPHCISTVTAWVCMIREKYNWRKAILPLPGDLFFLNISYPWRLTSNIRRWFYDWNELCLGTYHIAK